MNVDKNSYTDSKYYVHEKLFDVMQLKLEHSMA